MDAVKFHRVKPDFDAQEAYRHIRAGVWVGLVTAAFGPVLALSFIEEAKQRHILPTLVGLFFLPVLLGQLALCVKSVVDGVAILSRRRKWIAGAVHALAEIVGREHTVEVDYYGYKSNRYALQLCIDYADDRRHYSGKVIEAIVSRRIYDKYTYMDVACVHYSALSPLTFLFRGE